MAENQIKHTGKKADFEKAANDLLREALKRSYTERFLFATTLYKIQMTLQKATITHHPGKEK
jgi:hypothetical protein